MIKIIIIFKKIINIKFKLNNNILVYLILNNNIAFNQLYSLSPFLAFSASAAAYASAAAASFASSIALPHNYIPIIV